MMDDYDIGHFSKYKGIINFYCDNNYDEINEQNIIDTIDKSVCIIDKKYYKEFCERLINCINRLKNGLSILECRSITNLGARIHCINPNNYDDDFGSRPDWYLVQVWRGT